MTAVVVGANCGLIGEGALSVGRDDVTGGFVQSGDPLVDENSLVVKDGGAKAGRLDSATVVVAGLVGREWRVAYSDAKPRDPASTKAIVARQQGDA